MLRRNLLKLLTGTGAIFLFKNSAAYNLTKNKVDTHSEFSITGNVIKMYMQGVTKMTRIFQISDTHLWMDDDRGLPFQAYSFRMSKAYNKTLHFQTGAETQPSECFEKTLKIAKEENADLLVLTGDIFSFPSEAAIEWVLKKLQETDIPFIYTAGNHDWHYEGMQGSSEMLRDVWINKRLLPLYNSENPLMSSRVINGLNIVTIDNSTYEVNAEQRAFFKNQVKSGLPILLMQHIPMYAKGRDVGFGCGHPDWSSKTDKGFETEKRERWPDKGHDTHTLGYYDDVFSSTNVKGIFAGHIHQQSVDLIRNIPQFVTEGNAVGAYLRIDIIPS